MKSITLGLKKAIQELLFDQKLVHHIKKSKMDQERLYNHLTSGRITLEEYVHATN